jgi:hypothetical protein
MKIVVLSTDTEHYLLQWWLPHHASKFDFGVILDFNYEEGTADNTYELYTKHVPHWRYLKIKQQKVSTFLWDVVVERVERDLLKEFPKAWITTLNPTEFLIGNLKCLDNIKNQTQVLMPCYVMVDLIENENKELDTKIPILNQRHHGVDYRIDLPDPLKSGKTMQLYKQQNPNDQENKNAVVNLRWMRSIHNYEVNYLETSIYSVGRHYWDVDKMTDKLAICHMNFSPYNDAFISRKMNVQRRLTDSDIKSDRGYHHRVDKEKILERKRFYDQLTVDLSQEINRLESL